MDESYDKLVKNHTKSEAKAQTGKKRLKSSNMNPVNNVLPSVLTKFGLEKRLREHTLLQVWASLLPPYLSERCRPLFIDSQRQLVVTVSDASAAQELSMLKGKLLKALSITAKSLGITVESIRIDMKSFHMIAPVPEKGQEPASPRVVNEGELAAVELSKHDRELIVELSHKLESETNSDPELNLKALKSFESQLRLLEWRRLSGYPVCDSCKIPSVRVYESGLDKLCFNCKLQNSM